MKRRNFVKAGIGLAAGQLGATRLPAQQHDSGSPVARISRLVDDVGAVSQDVLFWNEVIYCLYVIPSQRQFGITATSPEGAKLWRRVLPDGQYLSLGAERGGPLLVHALSYRTAQDRFEPNCLLRCHFDGAIELIGNVGTSLRGKLRFAGESYLIGLDGGAIEIWSVDGRLIKRVGASTTTPAAAVHVDNLRDGVVAVTRQDGASISTIEIPSGLLSNHPILAPDVAAAVAYYQNRASTSHVVPIIIPASGCDQAGSLYGLVLPSPPYAVRAVKFDINGTGSRWRTFRFPSGARGAFGAAVKLIFHRSEVGIVYADGSVAWYSV
jgi:hypothetical protein